MKYTVDFFIRTQDDELVNFGQEEVNKFVDVVKEHVESRCGFVISPNQLIDIKSATFDQSDGSITLKLISNIKDNYLVTSVFDVIPYCPTVHNNVLDIFGGKITYESDIATKGS